jgi:hypothetical protein
VSGRRRGAAISVSREYKNASDDCVRALSLLLKTPVHKEAAHPAAPKGNVKE